MRHAYFTGGTIQYFIDTPLVGLVSDKAANNINIPIKNSLYNKYYHYILYNMHI